MVAKNSKQQRSASNSSRGGGGKGQSGGGKPGSPRKKIVTDKSLLCRNFLKGKCDKGDIYKPHHNGVCTFFAKGTCKKGDDCIYGHVATTAAPALSSEVTAKPGQKKKEDA